MTKSSMGRPNFDMPAWYNVNFAKSAGHNKDEKGGSAQTENLKHQPGLHLENSQ